MIACLLGRGPNVWKAPEEGEENLVPSEKGQGHTSELPKMPAAWLGGWSLTTVIPCRVVKSSAEGELCPRLPVFRELSRKAA